MKVLKFGGSSIKDAAAMKNVAGILQKYPLPVMMVLSLVSGTTDALLWIVNLASQGNMERVTTLKQNIEKKHLNIMKKLGLSETSARKLISDYFSIFAAYLQSLNRNCEWFDVRQVMITDDQFGAAMPNKSQLLKLTGKHLKPPLKKVGIIVTQGFIGSTGEGLTTTLGRGGSDYGAALLGNALDAESIEIWTDLSGVMTADPRLVKQAYTQHELSFQEAAELAFFGAKVLHPSTIVPAMEKKIPVIVKNSLELQNAGTRITPRSKRPGECKAIAVRSGFTVLTVKSTRMLLAYGFLEQIFDVFARHKVTVDLISTSEISVALTDYHRLPELLELTQPEFISFRINPGIGRGGFEGIVTGGTDAKFGIPYEQVHEAYQQALEAGIKRFGIHMMTGSNILEPFHFAEITQKLTAIAREALGDLNIQLEFINIGGGLGTPYTDEEDEIDLDLTFKLVGEIFHDNVKKI